MVLQMFYKKLMQYTLLGSEPFFFQIWWFVITLVIGTYKYFLVLKYGLNISLSRFAIYG